MKTFFSIFLIFLFSFNLLALSPISIFQKAFSKMNTVVTPTEVISDLNEILNIEKEKYNIQHIGPFIEFWVKGKYMPQNNANTGKFIYLGSLSQNYERIRKIAENNIFSHAKISYDTTDADNPNGALIIYADFKEDEVKEGIFKKKPMEKVLKEILSETPVWRLDKETIEVRFLKNIIFKKRKDDITPQFLKTILPLDVLKTIFNNDYPIKLTSHQRELILQLLNPLEGELSGRSKLNELVLFDILNVTKSKSREDMIDGLRNYVYFLVTNSILVLNETSKDSKGTSLDELFLKTKELFPKMYYAVQESIAAFSFESLKVKNFALEVNLLKQSA